MELSVISAKLPTNCFEITNKGVWSVSSYKPDFGLSKLKDGNMNTFWQSSGPQPHFINVSFSKKTAISKVCLYLDYKIDESYTPSKIKIRYGTHLNDLQDFGTYDFSEPSGWVTISLYNRKNLNSLLYGDKTNAFDLNPDRFLRVFLLQIAILANHLNGRDTHVRLIKVFSPGLKNNSLHYSIPYSPKIDSQGTNTNDSNLLDILYKDNKNELFTKFSIIR